MIEADGLRYQLIPDEPLAEISGWFYDILIPLRGADRHKTYDEADRHLIVKNDQFFFCVSRHMAPEDHIRLRWSAIDIRPSASSKSTYGAVRGNMEEAMKHLKEMLAYLHSSKPS